MSDTIYLGNDNAIEWQLTEDGTAVNLASVSRMTLELAGLTIDSASHASVFDWSGGDKVVVSLGQQAIPTGYHVAQLTVYDASNPNGIVWGQSIIQVEP